MRCEHQLALFTCAVGQEAPEAPSGSVPEELLGAQVLRLEAQAKLGDPAHRLEVGFQRGGCRVRSQRRCIGRLLAITQEG